MIQADLAVRHGPVGWPDRTAVHQVAGWCHDWLTHPDGDRAGEPWEFTDEQYHFLAWWFAVDDQGRWVYRRGTLRRMKGWGKDPVGAVLCGVEAFGPCRFSHIEDGIPVLVAHPAAWVQVAAVSEAQTRTTTRLFPGLLPQRTRDQFGLELHQTMIHIDGGRSLIEAVTKSPLSAEGPRVTFVLRNEVQNWLRSNQGHEMDEVIAGNLAKSRDGAARALSLCNAHTPGVDSVAEREWKAWEAISSGQSRATGVLYSSLEAPPDTDLADEDSLRAGLLASRGDSDWLDIDRLVAEIWDPRTLPSESRRKYLNQIVAAEDAFVAPPQWERLYVPKQVDPADSVAIGFDGSRRRRYAVTDATAIVGCRVSDGHLFTIGIWEEPDPVPADWQIPAEQVDRTMRSILDTLNVVGVACDPTKWESWVAGWERDYGPDMIVKAGPSHPMSYWSNQARSTRQAEMLHSAIVEGELTHDGNPTLTKHVLNARRIPNRYGVSFAKPHPESADKVDGLSASSLAWAVRMQALSEPEAKTRKGIIY